MPTAMPWAAVGEQVRKSGRQDRRLFSFAAIVGRPEVDRVLVDPVEELGHRRQARLGVAHRGGVIAVDIAEIALAVDQRIALREILCEADQGIVDRLVAVGVELAHHVADHTGALLEARVGVSGGAEPHGDRACADGPASGRRGRRAGSAVHDGRERIGEVALARAPTSVRRSRYRSDPDGGSKGLAHDELPASGHGPYQNITRTELNRSASPTQRIAQPLRADWAMDLSCGREQMCWSRKYARQV